MRHLSFIFLCLTLSNTYAQDEGITVVEQKAGINNAAPTTTLEVSADANPTLRLSEGASQTSHFDIIDFNGVLGQIQKLSENTNSLIDIDAMPINGVDEGALRLFRHTNTSGRVSLQIMKANGTAELNHLLAGNNNSYLCSDMGNLGVGTSAPLEKLDVLGNIAMHNGNFLLGRRDDDFRHQLIGIDAYNTIVINRSAIVHNKPSSIILGVGTDGVLDVRNGQNGSLLAIKENSGYMGLGTNNPQSPLHLRNINDGADIYSGLRFQPAVPPADVVRANQDYHMVSGFRRKGLWLGGSANGNLYTRSNILLRDDGILLGLSDGTTNPELSPNLFIGSNGNVGIGIANPFSALDVNGNSRFRGRLMHIGQDAGDQEAVIELGTGRSTTGHAYLDLVNDPSDNPSFSTRLIRYNVGATSLIHKGSQPLYLQTIDDSRVIFYIAGEGRVAIGSFGIRPSADNQYSSGSSTQRWQNIWSANGVQQTSDLRLKKDIIPLDNGLSKVMQLNPVTYRWKKSNDQNTKLGFIAQEVQEVIPEVVTTPTDPDEMLSMNYAEMIPVLVSAIQEQQKQIDLLRAENAELSSEMAGLQKDVDNMENDQVSDWTAEP